MASEYAGIDGASSKKPVGHWLSIVGIGENGLAGLGNDARSAIESAEFVFGGKRHLALAAGAIKGEALAWPVPFDVDLADVIALRGRKVCVLASGDPFFYGVGVTLLRQVALGETISYLPHRPFRWRPRGLAGPCRTWNACPCMAAPSTLSARICIRVRNLSS